MDNMNNNNNPQNNDNSHINNHQNNDEDDSSSEYSQGQLVFRAGVGGKEMVRRNVKKTGKQIVAKRGKGRKKSVPKRRVPRNQQQHGSVRDHPIGINNTLDRRALREIRTYQKSTDLHIR